MSVAYYELTLTSTSKEELEKIQFQLTKTLFEPHWKVTTGNIEERCEHGIEWGLGDCSDCPEGEGL